MAKLTLSGQVTSGQGQGASFTQLNWVAEQFIAELGIEPYPGTLNLNLSHSTDLALWADLRTKTDRLIFPPDPAWCRARGYPVRIAGRVPGAIILPEVPSYPESQLEVIAALPLRQELALADGDDLTLEINQPLPVHAVIFDVDGTLVDTLDAFQAIAELAAAPYALPVSQDMVRHALNYNQPTFWELVVPADRPDRLELMETLKKEAMRRWPEMLRVHGRVIPGLHDTLVALRDRGFRLGIVTASHSGSFQPLRDAGLLDFFEVIVTGADVSRRKPDPEGLLKCATALGVEPDQAVYVGDTITDVQASRAAGMSTVAVLSGAGDSALLSTAGPDWLIHSQARLPDILATIRK